MGAAREKARSKVDVRFFPIFLHSDGCRRRVINARQARRRGAK